MPSPELTRRAEFGARFEYTTNLAQRRRYQEAQEEYATESRSEGRQQFEQQLSRAAMEDPLKAETLRLGQQRERRMSGEAIAREDRFFRQEDAAERRFQTKLQLDEQKLKLDELKAGVAQRKALREMQDAQRVLEQTDALEAADFELRQNGLLPGSEGYAAGITAAAIQHPYADPTLRKTVLGQARVDVDEEELMARAGGSMKNPKLSMTVTPEGKTTYRISEATVPATKQPKPADPDADMRALETEHRALIGDFNREQDPSMKAHFEKRIQGIRQRITSFGQAPATTEVAPTATEPAVSAPVVGEIRKGYRFSGGDPASPSSWSKEE
jgi:hypothetical protein